MTRRPDDRSPRPDQPGPRRGRLLLGLAGGPFAAVGLVAAPLPALVVATVTAAFAAGLVGFLAAVTRSEGDHSSWPGTGDPASDLADDPTGLRRAMMAGLAAAGTAVPLLWALVGVAVLAGSAGALLAVTAGAGWAAWACTPRTQHYWRHRRRHRHRLAPAPVEPDPAPGPRPLVHVLASLSTPALCAEWQRSFWALRDARDARDTAAQLRIAQMRSRYLDELQRRDPDALTRWLATASRPAAGNPRSHFSCPTRDSSTAPTATGTPPDSARDNDIDLPAPRGRPEAGPESRA